MDGGGDDGDATEQRHGAPRIVAEASCSAGQVIGYQWSLFILEADVLFFAR